MVSRTPPNTSFLVSDPSPMGSEEQPSLPHDVSEVRDLERTVRDKLQSHPGLNVASLVIHRCPSGLCVEGHVVQIDPDVNLAALLAEIETSTPILNRVLISTPAVDVAP